MELNKKERYRIYRLTRFILRRRKKQGKQLTLCALIADILAVRSNDPATTPERLLPEFAAFRPSGRIENATMYIGNKFWPFWWDINDYRSRLTVLSSCIQKTKE